MEVPPESQLRIDELKTLSTLLATIRTGMAAAKAFGGKSSQSLLRHGLSATDCHTHRAVLDAIRQMEMKGVHCGP